MVIDTQQTGLQNYINFFLELHQSNSLYASCPLCKRTWSCLKSESENIFYKKRTLQVFFLNDENLNRTVNNSKDLKSMWAGVPARIPLRGFSYFSFFKNFPANSTQAVLYLQALTSGFNIKKFSGVSIILQGNRPDFLPMHFHRGYNRWPQLSLEFCVLFLVK